MPITFFLQSNKRPAAIYVRFREGRKIDAKARTQFTVNPEHWSAAKGKAKENDNVGKSLNFQLDKFRSRLTDRLNKRAPGEQVTTEWLKDFINPSESGSKTSLVYFFNQYIKSKESEITEGKATNSTAKKLKANLNLLKRMQEDCGTEFTLEEINLSFVSKYKEYCQKQGYAQNTISRAIKYIVTVCRDARRQGIPTHKELDYIKEKNVKVKSIYLTFDDLDKIEKAGKGEGDLPEYLDNARDWLIISCYTGQRISDFMRFSKDMLKTEKGKLLLEFTQVKTKKVMTIPVHAKVKAILDKRGDFPRAIADTNYNEYIKEVCKRSGLTDKVSGSKTSKETKRKESGIFEKWQLVSSHIGRRSFASNFFGQIPTSLLMFVTGHTTESQFYDYIGKAERTKAMQLAEYF